MRPRSVQQQPFGLQIARDIGHPRGKRPSQIDRAQQPATSLTRQAMAPHELVQSFDQVLLAHPHPFEEFLL